MTLDHAVAQAVVRTRVLEAALHSDAPWFVEIGGVRALAYPERFDHGVRFRACFVEVPPEANSATLYEGQEFRLARLFTYPGPGEFCVNWDVFLGERASA